MKNLLYKNVGEVFKLLAFALPWSVGILCIIFGFFDIVRGLSNQNEFEVIIGLLFVCVAPPPAFFATYLVTLPIYGFGEIISRLISISDNIAADRAAAIKAELFATIENSKGNNPRPAGSGAPTPVPAPAVAEEHLDEDDDEESEDSEIEVVCPACKETLYFNSGVKDAQCPYCDSKIVIPEVATK